jgi:hypothetical protein
VRYILRDYVRGGRVLDSVLKAFGRSAEPNSSERPRGRYCFEIGPVAPCRCRS